MTPDDPTGPVFPLAAARERIAEIQQGRPWHSLNPAEWDAALFSHPDVVEADLNTAAWYEDGSL